jgi:hypothetical protein
MSFISSEIFRALGMKFEGYDKIKAMTLKWILLTLTMKDGEK